MLQIPLGPFLLKRIHCNKIFLNSNNTLGRFIELDTHCAVTQSTIAKSSGLMPSMFENTVRSAKEKLA